MMRGRQAIDRRAREVGDDPYELGEAFESSDALRLRLIMWLARSHGQTARVRAATLTAAATAEVELPPTVRRRRRPRT